VVLVTELFPPDVGGTPVLFENIYTRLGDVPVTVLTNGARRSVSDGEGTGGRPRIVHLPMIEAQWGIRSVRSVRRYWRVAAQLRAEWRRREAVFHCARALPEGFAALCATRIRRSARYVCWTHGEELQYAKSSRELTALLAWVHRGAAAIIANSRNTARELELLGVPREKVHVVYPGVDVERFALPGSGTAVRERYAPGGETLLVTVGRLQRRKGHDLTIEALASVKSELPHLRYLVVGDGQERARLEALVDRCGMRDRVSFTGAVRADELPAYYAAADIFVHPNRVDEGDVEGFGIVFLEAAAAGLPVIGGNSGGAPEAIEGGVTGLLVSGTDVTELAKAIRTLAESAALRRKMGEAGRARVSQQFTWDRAAAEVMAIQNLFA
jgi:phosphatidylinositol alpha-1,6-mannosyltransferase